MSVSRVLNAYIKRIPTRKLYSSLSPQHASIPAYFDIVSDPNNSYQDILVRDMNIYPDFVTEDEESAVYDELKFELDRKRYDDSHWDDAIAGFREVEKISWKPSNKALVQKIKDFAFPSDTEFLDRVHVLDLEEKGYIKPHVDSVRFCGRVIAGLSLLSDSIMRLSLDEDRNVKFDVLLRRRSLYVMKDEIRYKFAHEILKKEDSVFKGTHVDRGRRISVICRCKTNSVL